jgi:hypothetical protein
MTTIAKGHLIMVPADPAWNSEDDDAVAVVTKVWADGSDGKPATVGVRILADNNQSVEWRTVAIVDAKPDVVSGEPLNYGIGWMLSDPPAKSTSGATGATGTTDTGATGATGTTDTGATGATGGN